MNPTTALAGPDDNRVVSEVVIEMGAMATTGLLVVTTISVKLVNTCICEFGT